MPERIYCPPKVEQAMRTASQIKDAYVHPDLILDQFCDQSVCPGPIEVARPKSPLPFLGETVTRVAIAMFGETTPKCPVQQSEQIPHKQLHEAQYQFVRAREGYSGTPDERRGPIEGRTVVFFSRNPNVFVDERIYVHDPDRGFPQRTTDALYTNESDTAAPTGALVISGRVLDYQQYDGHEVLRFNPIIDQEIKADKVYEVDTQWVIQDVIGCSVLPVA